MQDNAPLNWSPELVKELRTKASWDHTALAARLGIQAAALQAYEANKGGGLSEQSKAILSSIKYELEHRALPRTAITDDLSEHLAGVMRRIADPLVKKDVVKLMDELVHRENACHAAMIVTHVGACLIHDSAEKTGQPHIYQTVPRISRGLLRHYHTLYDHKNMDQAFRKKLGEPLGVRITIGQHHAFFTPLDEDHFIFMGVIAWDEANFVHGNYSDTLFLIEVIDYAGKIRELLTS